MSSLFPFLNRVQNSIVFIEVKGVPDKLWTVIFLLVIIWVGAAYAEIKSWCLIFLAVLIVIILFLAVGSYLFFMFKAPDYLRSESYQIRKQAIETLGDKDGLLPTDIAQVINIPYSSPNMLINQDEEIQDEK